MECKKVITKHTGVIMKRGEFKTLTGALRILWGRRHDQRLQYFVIREGQVPLRAYSIELESEVIE